MSKNTANSRSAPAKLDETVSQKVAQALSASSRPQVARKGKATAAGIVRQFNERISHMRSKHGWTWNEISDLLSAETGQKITPGALSRAASRYGGVGQGAPVKKKDKPALEKVVALAGATQPNAAAEDSLSGTHAQDAASNPWRCFDD